MDDRHLIFFVSFAEGAVFDFGEQLEFHHVGERSLFIIFGFPVLNQDEVVAGG